MCTSIIMLSWLPLLFCLSDASGPVMKDAYTIIGKDIYYYYENNVTINLGSNNASWYYDYSYKRMRYNHGLGQQDAFCWMNVQQPIECDWYYDPSGNMYVNYPSKNYCCILCPKEYEYCSVLQPTWIENGTFDGDIIMNNRSCNVWHVNGGQQSNGGTIAYYWAQDEYGIPCAYMENFYNNSVTYWHQLNFAPTTYVVGEPANAIFTIPSNCNQLCNNTLNYTSIFV